jgi:hypothetical protein
MSWHSGALGAGGGLQAVLELIDLEPLRQPAHRAQQGEHAVGNLSKVVVEVRLDVRHVVGAELGHARPDRPGERRCAGCCVGVVAHDRSCLVLMVSRRSLPVAREPVGQAADRAGDARAERSKR